MTKPVDYLLIGHVTADLTPEGRLLGGTVSYAARTVHAFGLQVSVLTSAAVDEPLLDGITPYADVLTLPAEATSTFENIYTPTGRIQYLRAVAAPIGPEDIPERWRSPRLVHLAPLTAEVDPRIAHLFPDVPVLLTLQGWLRRWDRDGRVHFRRWFDADVLKDIDIVVFSEEDIVEAPELEQELVAVVPHVFVTRAERGGTYYRSGEAISYDTPQVKVLQPTGAGDVFAAALLAGWSLLDGDMLAATRIAARMGATSVTRIGLEGAPTPDEARRLLLEEKKDA